MNEPAELKKLSSEQLWAKVDSAHEAVQEERKRGIGVAAIIDYENLIHEITNRIQYVDLPTKGDETWAIADDEENWGSMEEFDNREDAIAAVPGYAEEYGLEPGNAIYVAKQVPCNDMLAKHLETDQLSSYMIDADDIVNHRMHESLELHEDCTVSKNDTQDLQRRLRLTLREWNEARSPFGGWWRAEQVETFFWDGEIARPWRERKDWEGAQKGA